MLGVFIRGRNTAGIIEGACRARQIDDYIIVCRENDRLREDGDILVKEAIDKAMNHAGGVVVVANGGTTAQVVPLVGIAYRRPGVEVVDAQRDGVHDFHFFPTQSWDWLILKMSSNSPT